MSEEASDKVKVPEVSSSAASLDELEDADEQPPTPVAVPDLLKQPAKSPEASGSSPKDAAVGLDAKHDPQGVKSSPKDAEPAADHKAVATKGGDPLGAVVGKEEPLVSIPLGANSTGATADNTAPPQPSAAGGTSPGASAAKSSAANKSQETLGGTPPEASAGNPGAVTPQEGLHGEKSLDSDAGTLVVHSSASNSPPVLEDADSLLQHPATLGSQASGASTANAYFTARGDPEKADLAAGTPSGSRNLEQSFEGISVGSQTASKKERQSKQAPLGSERGRTGVTASPPRSPKAGAPPLPAASKPVDATTAHLKEALRSESSGAHRQDSNSVAEELQEAEARAEAEALAASQRDQTGRRETAEEGRGLEGAASFTEENLQSTAPSMTVANGGGMARPMSPPPAPPRPLQAAAQEVAQSYEPPEYAGLVFHDGIDALGRPVVVVNADALAPRASRKDAITYMQQRLEPIVVQGPYVIVFLNSRDGSKSRLSPGWLASCYRQLSYPFRKNVKHVILVRPSAGLKFMLAIVRPLLSPKAYVKVKKVASLAAIAAATNSEVTIQHLGPRFAATLGQKKLEQEMVSL